MGERERERVVVLCSVHYAVVSDVYSILQNAFSITHAIYTYTPRVNYSTSLG